MTTPSDVVPGNITLVSFTAEDEAFFWQGSSVYISTTLILYWALTTLDREVANIWPEPLRPASMIYLFIRYGDIISQGINTCLNSYTPNCNAVNDIANVASIVSTFSGYVFQIVRTWAACGRKKWVLVLLTICCIPAVAGQVWQTAVTTCNNPYPSGTLNWLRCTELVFESLILLVTIAHMWQLIADERRLFGGGYQSIARAIVNNGIIYYCIIVLFDIVAVPLYSDSSLDNLWAKLALDIIFEFNYPLRALFLCNWILDLRTGSYAAGGSLGMSTSNFQGTLRLSFALNTLQEDFGDPQYPPPLTSSVDAIGNLSEEVGR